MFCLIRSKTSALGEVNFEWTIVTSPFFKAREISHKIAKRIIKEYKMHLAHSTEDGQIYEEEGNPFLQKYKGCGDYYKWKCEDSQGFIGGSTDGRVEAFVKSKSIYGNQI